MPRRGGYVLVYVAMLMFAFFGLAALVIDLGMARLTQLQMQSAADSAAQEGLRFRDAIPAGWWSQTLASGQTVQQTAESAIGRSLDITNATDRDSIRRWAASYMVANIFDDDMNPNDIDTSGNQGQPGNWGAGPQLDLSGGISGSNPAMAAGQLLTIPAAGQRAYKPSLQLNAANDQYGDMVSGAYGANANYTGSYPYEEDSQYNRADFEPAADPTGGETAFLARLRRTSDVQGLDNQSGISSAGPTIPFLFGRGSTIQQAAGSSYSPRQQGLTVRGTSIANARPAVAIGPPLSAASIEGLSNVSVVQAFWEKLNAGNTGYYTPVLQVEPIAVGQTTVTVDGPMPGGLQLLPAPCSFYILVDSEIMFVAGTVSNGTGGQSWNVPAGAQSAHAAPCYARLLPSFCVDVQGNLLDTPVVVSNSGNTLTVAGANRLAAFGASGTSVFDPSSYPSGFPILSWGTAAAATTVQAISINSTTNPGALQLTCGAVLSGPIDLIVPASTIDGSSTQISVTAPAAFNVSGAGNVWYFDSPAGPALGDILLIHDVSAYPAADPNAEYVRLTSFTPPSSAGNYNYTLTVERGLFGTAGTQGNHSGSTIALTPVAGCVFGTTTLGASAGVDDDTISLADGSGFPLAASSANAGSTQFIVQIDQELLGVTGAAGAAEQSWSPRYWANASTNQVPGNWTVARGLNGTAAAAHALGASVALADSLQFGDPIQAALQPALPATGTGLLPISDDFGSTLGAAVCGFGRVAVRADSLVSGSANSPGNYLLAPIPGAVATDPTSGSVAQNSSASFFEPFASDLAASASQSTLWQAMTNQLVDPTTGGWLPRNPVLAPGMVSTNIPPSQTTAAP